MSKRNIVWLVGVAIGLAIGWIVSGWLVGVIVAVLVLVASEIVERTRRRRIAAAAGREVPSIRRAVTSRRKKR